MNAFRTISGDEFTFTFDGRTVTARPGETIAAALIASGIDVVGRSFKYHRPRGIQGFHVEEPNAIVDVTEQGRTTPNVRATLEEARPGMIVRSVNAAPDAASDRNRFIDAFARFIPAGFYYKTFIWPDWHLFEPKIRAMAGLGRLSPGWTTTMPATQREAHCDVAIIGAGPAGLAAALSLKDAGRRVVLIDDRRTPGGALSWRDRDASIDGRPAALWASDAIAALKAAGVTVLARTTAFGLYDHGLLGLAERHDDGRPETLWRLRTGRVIVAAGAIERPLAFANNDRPGILTADALAYYAAAHGIVAGRRIVLATGNSTTAATAALLARSGATVTLVDARADGKAPDGIGFLPGRRVVEALGRPRINAVKLDDGTVIPCDTLGVSGGYTPTIHIHAQAGGKLRYDEDHVCFLPAAPAENVAVTGAANGAFDLSACLADGARAGHAEGGAALSFTVKDADPGYAVMPLWPDRDAKGRIWIDAQNDVTAKDVALAARENYISVEHLKRYTTLGMANDQGKTSNMNGLALMASLTGRAIPEVGTTTYRPPFIPVSLQTFSARRTGINVNPVKRLPLDRIHRADGAIFMESGGWLRPAWYGGGENAEATRIPAEAKAARENVALFDGSTLGKIEVIGPKAAEFLDFVFYNTISTLKPGKCRYGFILTETGMVYDDGVVARLSDTHFVVSCSSSHVAGVTSLMEDWRQDRFDVTAVFVHNATPAYATLTVTGPKSRDLVARAGLGVDLDDAALPHMAFAAGHFGDDPLRVARVSFTGDRSYEITIRADRAEALWAHLKAAGEPLGVSLLGLEALVLLRAEKGYIIIGKDTDGATRPVDLGLTQPLRNKKVEFIGRRSLLTEDAKETARRQFVGLEVLDQEGPLDIGAHGVEKADGKWRSLGYVTSSHLSPTLGRPIALGLIENGFARMGETIDIRHMGAIRKARIVPACALDPEGERLHA